MLYMDTDHEIARGSRWQFYRSILTNAPLPNSVSNAPAYYHQIALPELHHYISSATRVWAEIAPQPEILVPFLWTLKR